MADKPTLKQHLAHIEQFAVGFRWRVSRYDPQLKKYRVLIMGKSDTREQAREEIYDFMRGLRH